MRLKTLYVLFLIELHTRQVRLAGAAGGTTAPWFLIRDRDPKFTRVFDDVFAADGTQVITTPVQAPNANAFAERWCGRSGRSVWTGADLGSTPA